MLLADLLRERKKSMPNKIGDFVAHKFLLDGKLPVQEVLKVDFKALATEFLEKEPYGRYYGRTMFDPNITDNCIIYAISCFIERKYKKHVEKYYGLAVVSALQLEDKRYLAPSTEKQRGFIYHLAVQEINKSVEYLDYLPIRFDFISKGEAGKLISCLQSGELTKAGKEVASKILITCEDNFTFKDFLEGKRLEVEQV